MAALDFTPEVRLANDALGLRSDTWYAGADQLGAVTPRPEIPAADLARLDIVTWAHESAVNNSLAALGGLRLDEATVRGLWQVQCKLCERRVGTGAAAGANPGGDHARS